MILTLLAALVLYPIFIIVMGLLGYFFGVLIAWIPFINDLFTIGLGLEFAAIPTILAWVMVVVGLISVLTKDN